VLIEALDELDRLEATVNQLLALARHRGRGPVDVPMLLHELERRWHPPLARLGRPLRMVVGDDLPAPKVSEIAISQVLDVLIDNAARHGAGRSRSRPPA
jgi:signal transduction histidine kinase